MQRRNDTPAPRAPLQLRPGDLHVRPSLRFEPRQPLTVRRRFRVPVHEVQVPRAVDALEHAPERLVLEVVQHEEGDARARDLGRVSTTVFSTVYTRDS